MIFSTRPLHFPFVPGSTSDVAGPESRVSLTPCDEIPRRSREPRPHRTQNSDSHRQGQVTPPPRGRKPGQPPVRGTPLVPQRLAGGSAGHSDTAARQRRFPEKDV